MSIFKRSNDASSYRLTLAQDLPPLKRQCTESGPSIPTDNEHKAVSFVARPFGLLDETAYKGLEHHETDIRVVDGVVRYATENDIAIKVCEYLRSILDGLGLAGHVEVYTEIGIFNVRPDLWVVTLLGAPIGVVEVKKPDLIGKQPCLNHPNVLGELYDFMSRLESFYGITPAFGILTTFETWRIAWFSDDQADQVAAKEELYQGPDHLLDGRPQHHGPAHVVEKHQLVEDDQDTSVEDNDNYNHDEIDDPRHLHVSKIFHRGGPQGEVQRALTSILLKMLQSKHTPVNPSDLANRRLIKFEKGPSGSAYWCRLKLEKGVQWNRIANPQKFLYALEDLGHGAHGRVWLACTSSGSVCVLKFSLSSNPKVSLDKEKDIWDTVYASLGIKVYREQWNGHEALRMPHFTKVQESDKTKTLPLLEKTLRDDYSANKVRHDDVEWRNVGTYVDNKTNKPKVILFDMGSASKVEKEDSKWIGNALEKLQDR